MNGTLQSQPAGKPAAWLPGSAWALVLCLLLVPAGAYLYQHRPNLYDHARTDLLEASRGLDSYYQNVESFVQSDRQGARALRDTIKWLQKAAASDPDDLADIRSITSGLLQWEQQTRNGELSPSELHNRYQVLAKRVDRLIKKHSRAATAE